MDTLAPSGDSDRSTVSAAIASLNLKSDSNLFLHKDSDSLQRSDFSAESEIENKPNAHSLNLLVSLQESPHES